VTNKTFFKPEWGDGGLVRVRQVKEEQRLRSDDGSLRHHHPPTRLWSGAGGVL